VPPTAPLAIVDAGKRVVVGLASAAMQATAPEVIVVSQTELETRLSWRAPRIEFTKTPLVEVLTLINQHSRVRVVLGDPALGQVRLSGVLRADNTHTLLRLLEEEHGFTAEPRGASDVVLRKAR
jgi:transmembrane sensor